MFISCNSSSEEDTTTSNPEANVTTDSIGVENWLTSSQGNAMIKQNNIAFSTEAASFSIVLDTTSLLQEIDGFGAALTGSSAYLIENLSSNKRQALLDSLFDPKLGIGISYLRITIGSSDFSLGNYTYCDESDISKFAIPDIDKRDLLPVLKEILSINPNISIMASPWTAPAWMKTSSSLNGGSLKSEYMASYAQYFVDYILAMKEQGIAIDAISLQNEPQYETTTYPSMLMEWQQQNEFIRDYVGPLFKTNNISTKILILDHNWELYSYPINILDDEETASYVSGTAFHGYSGSVSAMSQVYNSHTDKGIYFTEVSGGEWSTDFNTNLAWNMQNVFIGGVNNFAKNALLWNIALDNDSGPTNGGCSNCRGVVTLHDDGSFYKNVEYYSIAHFSQFVKSGAYRIINSSTGSIPDGFIYSTFLNSDKSKVVVVYNDSGAKQKFAINCGNRQFISTLSDNGLSSYKWE